MREVFSPTFGRVLTIGVGASCTLALVVLAVNDPAGALRALPWLALVAGGCWALFWRPHVLVEDSGVRLVNPFRTIVLAWPSIHAIDTRFALTLITAYGRFTCWAAPAPGARETLRVARAEAKHLPASTGFAGTVRPGDIPSTPSGSAALVIRRHWEALRDAGYLENPRLEHDAAPVTWHWGTIAAGAVLAVLAAIALVV